MSTDASFFLRRGNFLIPLIAALILQLSHGTAFSKDSSSDQAGKKCLYVSSFHETDNWSSAIENSIRARLHGHCQLHRMYMDTKRNVSPDAIFEITNQIIAKIEQWSPDVVITSDDSAAKHLIAQHYRNDKTPFVFSGVNWSVEEYGFPYENVTGIVEVAPIKTLLKEATTISGNGRRAVFLGADTTTEKRNFKRLQLMAETYNIQLEPLYFASFSQWKKALQKANDYDFAVLGINAAIKDWNSAEARKEALAVSRKPTFTTEISMMPYSTFGFTKLPSEQGEWAATVAIKILNGTSPQEIPIASNKKWEFWVNEEILDRLPAQPARNLLRKAKRFQPDNT